MQTRKNRKTIKSALKRRVSAYSDPLKISQSQQTSRGVKVASNLLYCRYCPQSKSALTGKVEASTGKPAFRR